MEADNVFYEFRDQTPAAFICPITHEIMKDPVMDLDGHSYERAAIEDWLQSGHTASPKSMRRLRKSDLVRNRALLNSIEEFIESHSGKVPSTVFQTSPMFAVQHQLRIQQLSQQQQQQIHDVYSDMSIRPAQRMQVAVARCRWVGDAGFRFRVYGEFAQYLHPQAAFDTLGRLDGNVKKDAEAAYIWVLTSKPEIVNQLEIINAAVDKFASWYSRLPDANDRQIKSERAFRFRHLQS